MAKLILVGVWLGSFLLTTQLVLAQNQLTLHELQTIESLIETGEVNEALDQLDQEIRSISRERGRNSTELIAPMILRGDAYMRGGDVQSAIESYDDARYISRQHYGLHDLSQVEILYREADAYYAANEILEANDRHEYAFSVFTRRYGTKSEQILPGLFRLASWYMDTQNIITARGLYESALTLSQDYSNPELVDYRMEALKNLAATYRQEKFRPTIQTKKIVDFKPRPYGSLNHPDQYYAILNDYVKGEQALLELVRLKVAVEEAKSEELAEAKLELGDWYLLFGKKDKASIVYRDIWDSLKNTPEFVFVEDHLMKPQPLYQPLPPDPVDYDEDDLTSISEGRVEFTLNVSEDGRTSEVTEILVRPSFMSTKIVQRALEDSIYRPAFADGEAINTDNVAFIHTFRYSRESG